MLLLYDLYCLNNISCLIVFPIIGTPLNFLKFSSKDWAKYNNNYLFQNRLRHQDFRKFFLDMNFEIIEEKKSSLGSPPKKISDEFEKNNDETFILWGQFVLKNI